MDDFWRRTAGPIPHACQPVRPNTYRQPVPDPRPYNGDFDKQPPRIIEGQTTDPLRCLVSLRFVWDNGECLGANIPYNLTPAGASVIRGGLDARGCLTQTIQGREYQAQLLADADVDNDVAKARTGYACSRKGWRLKLMTLG